MRHLRDLAVFLILALAASGQTLVTSRRYLDGGFATYRPIDSMRPPVLGAPVSYEVRVQTPTDGTQNTPVRLQRFWRDSQGRTRLERSFPPGTVGSAQSSAWPTVEIADPAAGFWYLLETEKKIVHRGRLPMPTPALPASVVSEDLGTRTINGVVAQGSRVSSTGPADGQGNDRPRVRTTETWTWPELQITLLTEVHDSRGGDIKMEIENLSREAPAASLFAPPADYRIVDETTQFTVSWGTLPAPPAPNPLVVGGAYRIGGGVSAPVPIYQPEPRYTDEARQAKISGAVLLSMVVDEEGKAQRLRVVKSLDPGLDQSAIETVSQWRFRPGQKDGKPVPVMASIEVNFRLLDGPKQ